MAIKIGIYGYGNLGKGVELAVRDNSDLTLVGVFTRRDPKTVKTLTGAPVYLADDALSMTDKIDVMIICGGKVTGIVDGRTVTKEEVGLLMTKTDTAVKEEV